MGALRLESKEQGGRRCWPWALYQCPFLPPAQAGPQFLCPGESSEHRVWAIYQQPLKGN